MANDNFPPIISLTGVDEKTSLESILSLAVRPGVEIAVLYSGSLCGQQPRFPSLEWIARLTSHIETVGGRIALHVCGTIARDQLLQRKLSYITNKVDRILFTGLSISSNEIAHLCDLYPLHTIITQYSESSATCIAAAGVDRANHALLMMRGEMIVPDVVDSLRKNIGYACNLGGSRLSDLLSSIPMGRRHGAWIDMENSLRTPDDRFDIRLATHAVEQLAVWRAKPIDNIAA